MADIIASFLLPLAVTLSATSATATAGIAWKLYQRTEAHDRALFGEDEFDGHDGLVTAVNENTAMTDRHRQVLKRHDMIAHDGSISDIKEENI